MAENIKAWVEYADEYKAKTSFCGRLIHTGLGVPGVEPSLVLKSSKTILDIGCGTGENTYLMAKLTDDKVVGIDPVKSQVDTANNKFKLPNLQFICADYQNVANAIKHEFELITFLGSLDYIRIDDSFFLTLDVLTRLKSRCYIAKFHPLWTTLFSNDVADETDYSYFDAGREDRVRYGNSEFVRYHYNFSELLSRFAAHHWILKVLSEPKTDFDNSAFSYLGYECDALLRYRLSRFPMTLVLEFEKER